jgi:TPP-dependent pyruvate/acetoin dehydrogenase alpha subunit
LSVAQENPLVPNAKLRQIYLAMAEARVLDEAIGKVQRRGKGGRVESTRGEEACRVSTAIDLGAGDLVSDSQVGVVMDLIAGGTASSLLKRVAAIRRAKTATGTADGAGIPSGTSPRVLPWIDDAEERLRLAMGAALGFKTAGQRNVVVAYVRHGEIAEKVWRRLLGLASKLELAVIFVVLPPGGRGRSKVKLGANSARWGVPGIPVDAGDAVALYRVAQESLGRTRGGDGPVLIECVEFGAGGKGPVDPLAAMGDFLLGRRVCTATWLKGAGSGLRRQIAALSK